jgi:hypothetical protein
LVGVVDVKRVNWWVKGRCSVVPLCSVLTVLQAVSFDFDLYYV